jgi:hypothetical protein
MELKKILSVAVLMGSLLTPIHAQHRNEIAVPNIDGYTTLKCDFHIHTVFSDGLVWPTVRVDEAYREGLDAIALTEHIEYRPHKRDIVADHKRSYDIAEKTATQRGLILIKGSEITRPMAPGHSNAIFLKDSNPLEKEKYQDSFAEAKKQGAFIFWNHPGWDSQQPDSTRWWPEHTELYKNGCMNGIEVANGGSYFPEAVNWCLEKNLTMMGTSDIHQPIQTDYDFAKGEHRTMTFVFAKDRSEEAIHEALNSRRTAVWYRDQVIGQEELLRAFFEKCILVKEVRRDEKGISLSITNLTDIPLQLIKTEHDPSLIYFRDYTLNPHTPHTIRVKFANGVKGGSLNFKVDNFVIGADKKLQYSISL